MKVQIRRYATSSSLLITIPAPIAREMKLLPGNFLDIKITAEKPICMIIRKTSARPESIYTRRRD